ncbi:MAG: MBL fold metallo-hydrolase [Actinobacteria bacterium]|nr:MBL fold metallo-hydrolase [Actinomycetota bacterium]
MCRRQLKHHGVVHNVGKHGDKCQCSFVDKCRWSFVLSRGQLNDGSSRDRRVRPDPYRLCLRVPSRPRLRGGGGRYGGNRQRRDDRSLSGPRELMALAEGNQVFGLEVIETPGHTAGHISLFDSAASVLVAGDALNGGGSGVEGPNPQFSEDHEQALASVGKMAGFEYETLYFGHGDPVMSGASAQVAELAASL